MVQWTSDQNHKPMRTHTQSERKTRFSSVLHWIKRTYEFYSNWCKHKKRKKRETFNKKKKVYILVEDTLTEKKALSYYNVGFFDLKEELGTTFYLLLKYILYI